MIDKIPGLFNNSHFSRGLKFTALCKPGTLHKLVGWSMTQRCVISEQKLVKLVGALSQVPLPYTEARLEPAAAYVP